MVVAIAAPVKIWPSMRCGQRIWIGSTDKIKSYVSTPLICSVGWEVAKSEFKSSLSSCLSGLPGHWKAPEIGHHRSCAPFFTSASCNTFAQSRRGRARKRAHASPLDDSILERLFPFSTTFKAHSPLLLMFLSIQSPGRLRGMQRLTRSHNHHHCGAQSPP